MLTLSFAVTAFVLPSTPISPTRAVRAPSVQALTYDHGGGSLPEMYRARWAEPDDNVLASSPISGKVETHDLAATIVGASCGVGLVATLGAFKSVASTPLSIAILNNAFFGSAYDISGYMDMITGLVATSNEVLLPALSVGADLIVLTSVVALMVLKIDEMLTNQPAASAEDELCLVTEAVEHICGSTSFDSSDGYACVEQWSDGKVRWVCA